MSSSNRYASEFDAIAVDSEAAKALSRSEHHSPHDLLGAHPAVVGDEAGLVLRAFHPDAERCEVLRGSRVAAMQPQGAGLFAVSLAGARPPLNYRLRLGFGDGANWEREDPYRFTPSIGETDIYLFNEGTHRNLWNVLGSRPMEHEGSQGTAFTVWAPNAKRVSVVGEFNQWDGRLFPMRSLGNSGVWEVFLPGVGPGSIYKYEIKCHNGDLRI